ncbi:MAG: histidinol-phosphate transaminase [Treponema sp.]|nr:histidinol-phosphate transaminase [Treponema sp.]
MLSKRLENLNPYVPGEQPKDREYIKLNANENPYSPSPKVKEAILDVVNNSLQKLGLYPDPESVELRESIAHMINCTGGVLCNAYQNGCGDYSCISSAQDLIPFNVTPDMIFCGNGSDEVLSFVFYTFFDTDRPLVLPKYTYSFYPVYAGFYNIALDEVNLKNDWTLDIDKMLLEANKYDTNIIFANPNAPTGLALSRLQVKEMLEKAPKDKVFVVDEAYVDFGGQSCIPLLKDFKNLVVVRTFSKSMSFAGMRLGYVVANPELIKAMMTVKNSFNHFPVDAIAQKAAVASCKDVSYYCVNAKKVAEERESFEAFLCEKGWSVIPSKTNFVFAKKNGKSGDEMYKFIKSQGILVRHFSTPGIEDYLRITIGTHEQMNALKKIMENL